MKKLIFSETHFWDELETCFAALADNVSIVKTVSDIISSIRDEGDAALFRFTEMLDGAELSAETLTVQTEELAQSQEALSPEVRQALEQSIANVQSFHEKTLPKPWASLNNEGAEVGERFYPLHRVGIYIPGGQVPLVSTVVMTVVLAKIAGVAEIAVATPPRADGSVDASILAALSMCDIREVYKMGGAQAMAAFALGTESLPQVNKILGPGNAYVMEAKRQLFGLVGVDGLPGPSEVMVISDEQTPPSWVAADLLAQAEHGSGKERLYFVCNSEAYLSRVEFAIEEALSSLPNAHKIKKIIEEGSLAVVVDDWDEAAQLANYIAPEHLELLLDEELSNTLAGKVHTAGALLVGRYTPAALGDFIAGPSHTLPTGRAARFLSGLQVSDFMRRSSWVRYDAHSLEQASPIVGVFSRVESLPAHGQSVRIRLEDASV